MEGRLSDPEQVGEWLKRAGVNAVSLIAAGGAVATWKEGVERTAEWSCRHAFNLAQEFQRLSHIEALAPAWDKALELQRRCMALGGGEPDVATTALGMGMAALDTVVEVTQVPDRETGKWDMAVGLLRKTAIALTPAMIKMLASSFPEAPSPISEMWQKPENLAVMGVEAGVVAVGILAMLGTWRKMDEVIGVSEVVGQRSAQAAGWVREKMEKGVKLGQEVGRETVELAKFAAAVAKGSKSKD